VKPRETCPWIFLRPAWAGPLFNIPASSPTPSPQIRYPTPGHRPTPWTAPAERSVDTAFRPTHQPPPPSIIVNRPPSGSPPTSPCPSAPGRPPVRPPSPPQDSSNSRPPPPRERGLASTAYLPIGPTGPIPYAPPLYLPPPKPYPFVLFSLSVLCGYHFPSSFILRASAPLRLFPGFRFPAFRCSPKLSL